MAAAPECALSNANVRGELCPFQANKLGKGTATKISVVLRPWSQRLQYRQAATKQTTSGAASNQEEFPTAAKPENLRAAVSQSQGVQARNRAQPPTTVTDDPQSNINTLNDRFGSKNISFAAAAGIRTAELSIADGSSCRVLIDGARVSSYQAAMWHGGQEEVLYSTTNDADVADVDVEPWNLIQGGIVISFPGFGGQLVGGGRVPLGECAARAPWQVSKATSNRHRTTLVLVSESSHATGGVPSSFWRLKCEVVLSHAGLSTTLTVTNLGVTPIDVAPSIVAHFAVADVEGCFLMGCQGYRYAANETVLDRTSLRKVVAGWWKGLTKRQKEPSREDSGLQATERGSQRGIGATAESAAAAAAGVPGDLLLWRAQPGVELEVEGREYADLDGGMCRLFPQGPDDVTLVDRGARRSFRLEGRGYADFFLKNPGSVSQLEDWPLVVALGFAQGMQTVAIAPRGTWSGELVIHNLGAKD